MELFIYNENRTTGLHFIYIELNQDDGIKGGQWYFQHTILNILAHVWVLYEYLITIIPVYLCSATFVLISVNICIYAELYSKLELNRWSELNDSCSKFKGKNPKQEEQLRDLCCTS